MKNPAKKAGVFLGIVL